MGEKFNPAAFVEPDEESGELTLPLHARLKWFYSEHPDWRITMEDSYEIFSFQRDLRVADEDDEGADEVYVNGYNDGYGVGRSGDQDLLDEMKGKKDELNKADSWNDDEETKTQFMEVRGFFDGYQDAIDNNRNKYTASNKRVLRNTGVFTVSLINSEGVRLITVHIDTNADEDGFAQLAYQKGIQQILEMNGFSVKNITKEQIAANNDAKQKLYDEKIHVTTPAANTVAHQMGGFGSSMGGNNGAPMGYASSQGPVGYQSSQADQFLANVPSTPAFTQNTMPPQPNTMPQQSQVSSVNVVDNPEAMYDGMLQRYYAILSPQDQSEVTTDRNKLRIKFDRFCLSTVGSGWKKIKNDPESQNIILARIDEMKKRKG